MALLLDLLVTGQTRLNDDTYAKNIYADKFIRTGSTDSYVLLGGGGHKLLSDFSMSHSHPYLPLSGGTMDQGSHVVFPGTSTDTNYGGSIAFREVNYVTTNQTDWSYAPGITFHWGGRSVGKLGLRSDGNLAWKNKTIIHSDNIGSQSVKYATSAGSANSADILNIKSINSETDIVQSGIRGYSGSGSSWTGSISSMKYAAIFSFGTPSRGWQLWAARTGEVGNGLCWRRGIQAATSWDSERLILDSNNYTDYTVKKDGTGASGTWGISITGNADTVDNQHFSYSNSSDSPTYLWATNSNGTSFLAARAKISVKYANSAGNADTLDSFHETSFFRARGTADSVKTNWDTIGILAHSDTSNKPDGLTHPKNYYWGESLSFPGSNGMRLDIFANCYSTAGGSDYTKYGAGLFYRTGWGSTKLNWYEILDSANYNSYSPKLDGTGASGTWGISITGTATSAGNADTVDNQHFSYANTSNSPTYLWATNSNGTSFLAARSSLSVNYATSAGNADTVDGQHFNWNNNKNDHTYLWAASSNGQAYLVNRANMSVNYANTASGLDLNRTSITTGAAGWYKLAYYASTDPRGSVRIGLVTVGGSFVPFYAELYVENGWSNINMVLYGRFDYISKFRFTSDSTNCYIEGYFPNANTEITLQKIKGVGYVSDSASNWNLYTTATPGSGTVQDSENTRSSLSSGLYTNRIIEGFGFVKSGSSDSYILLGGGGHKLLSDFSMSHSHPYLPLAGGTMTGAINLSSTNAKLAFGSLATSPITGYKAPSLVSNGVGIYSRYGGSSDEGAIIITEDTCVIYNSSDTGWNFQVMDKDIGTDMTNDATRSFGVNQNHQAWSLAGFVKSGSSDSYVLLGGGGHKALSDFSNATTATSLGPGALKHMCSLYATDTYNAYKITTDWHKSNNAMPTINIRGYAYGSIRTIDCDIVIYHLDNYSRNYSLTNKGSYPIRVWQAIENDVQVFYINPAEYFGMFNVFVYGGISTNAFSNWSMTTVDSVSGTEIDSKPIATSITGNADTVDGQHFNWNNNKNDHTFLWAASSNGQAYLVHRASMSVNYANSAGSVAWGNVTGKPSTFPVATHNHDDKYVKLNGTSVMTGDLTLSLGNVDRFIVFSYNGNTNPGSNSWRTGVLGSGNDEANYYVVQYQRVNTSSPWNTAFKIGQDTGNVTFTNNIAIGDKVNYYAGNLTPKTITLSTSAQTYITANGTNYTLKLPNSDPYTSARTPTAHTHYATTFKDSRNETMTPAQGANVNGIAIDFKTKANGVGAGSGSYCGLVTFDPYADVSGGYPIQIGFNTGPDTNNTNEVYIRTAKDSTTWNTWRTIINDANYTNYVNTTKFPGLNKVGTVTSVTVTGSNGLSGSGTITSSGTITLSNAGVRSVIINGNYLRVNTNGTNADLTIPYATNADKTDGLHVHSGRNNEANKIVRTDGNGYIQAGYINTNVSTENTLSCSRLFFESGNDGYIRKLTPARFRELITDPVYLPRLRMRNPSNGTSSQGAIPFPISLKGAGYPLYVDPEFAHTDNNVKVYKTSGDGTVTITRIADNQGASNSSGKILQISSAGTIGPGRGGFYQEIKSRANAVFAQIFRAKIPTGFSVVNAENSMGSGYSTHWLTDTAGTGKWEWYIRVTICGASGTFDKGGHVYLSGSGAVTWYLSYCNVIDLTKGNYDGLRTRYSEYATSAGYADSALDADHSSYADSADYASYVTVSNSNSQSTYRMVFHSGNTLYSTAGVYCNPSTSALYAAAFYESSDQRLKNFHNSLDVNLDKLKSIPKKYFSWKKDNDSKLHIGTSAQAIREIYPELVSESDDGMLSVDYAKLSIVALKAVDKLYEMNKNLERRIQILESKK